MTAQVPGAAFLHHLRRGLTNDWAAEFVQHRLEELAGKGSNILGHLDALLWIEHPGNEYKGITSLEALYTLLAQGMTKQWPTEEAFQDYAAGVKEKSLERFDGLIEGQEGKARSIGVNLDGIRGRLISAETEISGLYPLVLERSHVLANRGDVQGSPVGVFGSLEEHQRWYDAFFGKITHLFGSMEFASYELLKASGHVSGPVRAGLNKFCGREVTLNFAQLQTDIATLQTRLMGHHARPQQYGLLQRAEGHIMRHAYR